MTKRSVNYPGSQRTHLLTQGVGINPIPGPTTGAPSKSRGGSSLGRKTKICDKVIKDKKSTLLLCPVVPNFVTFVPLWPSQQAFRVQPIIEKHHLVSSTNQIDPFSSRDHLRSTPTVRVQKVDAFQYRIK